MWLLVWSISFPAIYGQSLDTTVWIGEISVTDHHLIGSDSDTISVDDQMNAMASVADVLRSHSSLYFRDFGPGSSTTVSMSGSRSGEVALIWNGIKIANPMLGVNDFSMVPVAGLSSLRLARTGASTIFGAGSGAGAIILDQEIPDRIHPVVLSAGWSTLDDLHLNGSYIHRSKAWQSHTSIGGLTAQNDYRYTTLNGEKETLPHARNQYLNGTHHSAFQLRPGQQLSVSLWAHQQFREIPPTLTEARSEAEQTDRFIRSVIQYSSLTKRHKWHLKGYFGHQVQNYQNPLINLDATHIFDNYQVRLDNHWQLFEDTDIRYGLQNNFFTSQSDNYADTKTQNRISAYAQIRYAIQALPLEWIVLLQPEWVSDQSPGWTTEIKLRYQHPTGGIWTIFANQNIVWPTLNDLHWTPGGNPELQPEYNKVGGLTWKNYWPANLQHNLTFYFKYSEGWIQWTPGSLGYWSPVNAGNGKSYGMNLEVKKSWPDHVEIKGSYQYARSVISGHGNRQTIYAPEHLWSVMTTFRVADQWRVQVEGQYTSTRYVSSDHSQSLDPYFLSHMEVRYSPDRPFWSIGLRLQNIFNTPYQGIINRPMPGRQIQINTQFKF